MQNCTIQYNEYPFSTGLKFVDQITFEWKQTNKQKQPVFLSEMGLSLMHFSFVSVMILLVFLQQIYVNYPKVRQIPLSFRYSCKFLSAPQYVSLSLCICARIVQTFLMLLYCWMLKVLTFRFIYFWEVMLVMSVAVLFAVLPVLMFHVTLLSLDMVLGIYLQVFAVH